MAKRLLYGKLGMMKKGYYRRYFWLSDIKYEFILEKDGMDWR